MNTKRYAEIMKEYANEAQVLPRSTSDLSPFETWLLIRLEHTEQKLPVLSDCCQASVITTKIHVCENCECSCSPVEADMT